MTHYQTLKGYPGSSTEELRASYYELMRSCHPDFGGDASRAAEINVAWDVLGDPRKRREYDSLLLLTMQPCEKCRGLGCRTVTKKFKAAGRRPCQECSGAGYLPRRGRTVQAKVDVVFASGPVAKTRKRK